MSNEVNMWIILANIAVLLVIITLFLNYSLFLKKKSKLYYYKILKETSFERELATSRMEMKEQTLHFVGHELYDDLGQKLSAAKIMTSQSLMIDQNSREINQKVHDLLGECIQDIRKLSKTFSLDEEVNFDFFQAIKNEIQKTEKFYGVEIQFRTNTKDVDCNEQHRLILFRIVQECIANISKYSNHIKIGIELNDSAEILRIEMLHNEKGCLMSNKPELQISMYNMKKRAKMIGAKILVNDYNERGNSVSIIYKKYNHGYNQNCNC